MRELVFSIGNVFDSATVDGCLKQYDSTRFHIPAYQRGFKWGSGQNGAVAVLLSDLKDAFEAFKVGNKKEYYLQYITVKKANVRVNGIEENHLEVIDGQQRLTTLSIMLSVVSSIEDQTNIAYGKLHYAIRENFFENHIYAKVDLEKIVSLEWGELIKEDNAMNKQDIFYLHSATRLINQSLQELKAQGKLNPFYRFVRENVMLIVNSVEPHVSSETVFKNLNSNQVPLTEAELIKGYLITRIGRTGRDNSKIHFREILELRANLGRKWDEMSLWSNRDDVKSFFFSHQEGMESLLKLAAMLKGAKFRKIKKGQEKDFHLFNFYHQLNDPEDIFSALQDTFSKLFDWFQNDELYNLIGYCRFAKGGDNNNLEFLEVCLGVGSKQALVNILEVKKNKLIQAENVNELKYGGEEDEVIHSILLALSVFPEGISKRFDFYGFEKEKWTLEHIFPQSPEGKKYVLTKEQRGLVKQMLGDKLTKDVKFILEKESRTPEEKEIYYKALKNFGPLNSIGNMCLLTGKDNSSNGNKFFKEKRQNILELIQKGSFVPKHTFDVFSKMITGLQNAELEMWTVDDIKDHTSFIADSIRET